MNRLFALGLIVILGMGTGCSKSKSADASSSPSVLSSVTTLNAKLDNAAAVIDSGTPFIGAAQVSAPVSPLSTGLHTVWTTDPGVQDLDNVGNYSLKKWFDDEFNPDFVNSNGAKVTFVGRISSALAIFCFMGALNFPTDASNLPTVGTHTGTLTSAMGTTCGDPSVSGQALTITVTAAADTTYYDRSFSVDMGNACPFLFKARVSGTDINIATSEDQNCDGRDQASAAVVLYNISTDVMRFTYQSQAFSGFPSGYEFYRGFYDGNLDQAKIIGIYGGDSGASGAGGLQNYVAYTVEGKPTSGGTVAVSAKIGSQTIADGVYNGCVNASTRAVMSSSNTLACTVTGTDITTPFTNTIVARRASYTSRAQIYTLTDTTSVGFTDASDIF